MHGKQAIRGRAIEVILYFLCYIQMQSLNQSAFNFNTCISVQLNRYTMKEAGHEVIKLFPCSTQLSMKFSLLINMKMPTILQYKKLAISCV